MVRPFIRLDSVAIQKNYLWIYDFNVFSPILESFCNFLAKYILHKLGLYIRIMLTHEAFTYDVSVFGGSFFPFTPATISTDKASAHTNRIAPINICLLQLWNTISLLNDCVLSNCQKYSNFGWMLLIFKSDFISTFHCILFAVKVFTIIFA